MDPVVGTAVAAVAAVSTYSVAKYQSTSFIRRGIVGRDIHKPNRPETAEMGGLAVLVGIGVGSGLYLVVDSPKDGTSIAFIAGLSAIGLVGLVGALDDLLELRQRYKPFLVVAASIPLIYFLQARGAIYIPVIGSLDIDYLYPIIVVPLAITTSANFTNMLAGFNGLESGMAVISIGTMSFLSAARGHPTIAVLGLILTVAYAGFFILNKYPARIFPGDTGTLMAGAAVASIGLLSGLEFEAVILSIPAAMDFALKAMAERPFSGRKAHGNTTISDDGTLVPASYPALAHAFMKAGPVTERGLVASLLVMQLLYALIAIVVALNFL